MTLSKTTAKTGKLKNIGPTKIRSGPSAHTRSLLPQQTPTPPNPQPSVPSHQSEESIEDLYDNPEGSAPPQQSPDGNPGGDPGDDPDQGGDPDNDPDDGGPEDPPPEDPSEETPRDMGIAEAMLLLAKTLQSSKDSGRTKVREPDCFDGSNPKKLRTFLVQCELNFQDRPAVFSNHRAKVNFALSYLSGTALAWFEPNLLPRPFEVSPRWLDNYFYFTQELRQHFGPYDAEAEAERGLENLVMRQNHHISKYVVEFYSLAAEVKWDDASLRRKFYLNLPDRIKDEMSRIEKPKTLNGMRDLAQAIDQRYWERDEEIRQAKKLNPSSNNNGQDSSSGNARPSDKKKKSFFKPFNNNNKNQPSGSSFTFRPNPNNSATPPKPTPEYANKLGKDGKLTTEERNRRILHKLCLFCGRPGHVAADCDKSTSLASKAKARAAQASSSDQSDSKK
jgi:hypothetical protein